MSEEDISDRQTLGRGGREGYGGVCGSFGNAGMTMVAGRRERCRALGDGMIAVGAWERVGIKNYHHRKHGTHRVNSRCVKSFALEHVFILTGHRL